MFPELFDRPVVVKFDQQQGSSDGGALLLKAADRRLAQVRHEAVENLANPFGISLSYYRVCTTF